MRRLLVAAVGGIRPHTRLAVLVASLLAMVFVLGCTQTDTEEGGATTPSLTVVPYHEPSLADCERVVASSPREGPVYRTEATVSPGDLAAAGLHVPSKIPERFSLARHGREERGALFSYEGADGGLLMVSETKVEGAVRIPSPPGATELVLINGETARLVRGVPTIVSRQAAGEVLVTGCGWDEETATRVYYLRGDTLVVTSVSPANAASDQELLDITASVIHDPAAP